MIKFDPTLYLIADRGVCAERVLESSVSEAIDGGITVVQFRDKASLTRQSRAAARQCAWALRSVTRRAGIPFIINDDIELASLVGADGVHLGQHDLEPQKARALLGPTAFIGLSVGTDAELENVPPGVVDYLGVGPIFPTTTKQDAGPHLTLSGLSRFRGKTSRTIVAIGGITVDNASAVISAGADGIAVASCVLRAVDCRSQTTRLKLEILGARGRLK